MRACIWTKAILKYMKMPIKAEAALKIGLAYVLKVLHIVSPFFFTTLTQIPAHMAQSSLSANLRVHRLHAPPGGGPNSPSMWGKQHAASDSGANLWLAEQLQRWTVLYPPNTFADILTMWCLTVGLALTLAVPDSGMAVDPSTSSTLSEQTTEAHWLYWTHNLTFSFMDFKIFSFLFFWPQFFIALGF